MLKKTTCCLSGPRPHNLPWGDDENCEGCKTYKGTLKKSLITALASGYTHFICGMAQGFDTYALEALYTIRNNEAWSFTIEAAVPFVGQSARWSRAAQARYNFLLSKCDKVTYVCKQYTAYCMHARNAYMVGNASLLISGILQSSAGGSAHTLALAQNQNLDIIVLE